MDKRYQVFVSSTYTDLQEERRLVFQTLMEMDCFPAGMEIFPAIDEEQFEFIKKVINDSDYYILIIGGRYGSITQEGISYTEKEYDYAVHKGLKVLSFIHEAPGEIALKKSEIDLDLRLRLEAFRTKVSTGKLVKFWSSPDQLAGLVATSLNKTITMYPAIGWIRGDKAASKELLNEVNDLRKKLADIPTTVSSPIIENLANLDTEITITGKYYNSRGDERTWRHSISWNKLFGLIAPYILEKPSSDTHMKGKMAESVFNLGSSIGRSPSIDDQIFQTTKIQFLALGLIELKYLDSTNKIPALFWLLTPMGRAAMLQARTIKNSASTTL